MERRSQSLQNRLNDIERRLRTMRTVTNTASAEISGGETIIDEDGSIFFMDGGKLHLGGSSVESIDGVPMINSSGDLLVDDVTIYGDILSASDYLFQRESVDYTVIDTDLVETRVEEIELEFPDWASSALLTYHVYLNTRIRDLDSNKVLITINGMPVARPRSDALGNVDLSTGVVRRAYPDNPVVKVEVGVGTDVLPSSGPRLRVTIGGVYTA